VTQDSPVAKVSGNRQKEPRGNPKEPQEDIWGQRKFFSFGSAHLTGEIENGKGKDKILRSLNGPLVAQIGIGKIFQPRLPRPTARNQIRKDEKK